MMMNKAQIWPSPRQSKRCERTALQDGASRHEDSRAKRFGVRQPRAALIAEYIQ